MLYIVHQHFEALERSRGALLDALGGVYSSVLDCAPRAGAWTLAEIAQHLMLCEEEVLRQMKFPRPGPRTIRDMLGLAMVNFVLRRDIRVKVPMDSVVPLARMSLDEIRQRWDEVRSS